MGMVEIGEMADAVRVMGESLAHQGHVADVDEAVAGLHAAHAAVAGLHAAHAAHAAPAAR
jgi:hypothetical protein